jgi:hypothetical protein
LMPRLACSTYFHIAFTNLLPGLFSNAENRAILSVLVSQAISYLLTQSHSRGGTSRFWCIDGCRGCSCHLRAPRRSRPTNSGLRGPRPGVRRSGAQFVGHERNLRLFVHPASTEC